jgi:glycosyltransferase involved in cell wall biosynthesis
MGVATTAHIRRNLSTKRARNSSTLAKGKMKICLYSPYVPKHLGGGEKYFFDVAKTLHDLGHSVSIGIPSLQPLSPAKEKEIQQQYENFLDYSLNGVEFVSTPLGTGGSFWQKLNWTRQFEVLYYVTDGSFFFSLAKKNIAHIQIPFKNSQNSFLKRIKLANWSIKNTNSEFTKNVVEKSWKTRIGYVHSPMISLAVKARPVEQKEKIILNVGRFFRQLHSKRQDILVKTFEEMTKTFPAETKGWKLILVGSVEDQQYVDEVKQLAQGLPVEIHTAVSRKELIEWYLRASIYWHATGYQVDELQNPEKVEHFGISTVEAMQCGDIPIVVGKGGQVEILQGLGDELLWQTQAECISKTLPFLKDQSLRKDFQPKIIERSKYFGAEQFRKTLEKMIGE